MLLKDSSYQGFWWIAGSDKRVPGVLEYSVSKGLCLKLNGSFASEVSRAFGGSDTVHEVVHGQLDLGKLVTLLNCSENRGVYHLGWNDGYNVSEYYVRLALLGKHFQTHADAVFPVLWVSAPNLGLFIGVSGISGEAGGPQEHRIVVKPAEQFSFRVGEYTVLTWHGQNLSRTALGIAVDEQPWLRITADEPAHLDAVLAGPIRSLHTLLELVVDSPLPISDLKVETADGTDVTVLRKYRQIAGSPLLEHSTELPFTLSSLGNERESAVMRWHEARQKYGPTFDLYFSVMRNSGIPVEHQFLFLVQALESFHRRAFVIDPARQARHASKLKAILDAVPSEYAKWLGGRLKHSHEPALEERIRQLHDSLPQRIKEQIGDGSRFARLMSRTRNYLTHFDEDAKGGALSTPQELWSANQQMSAVLKMLFLQTLGLNESQVLETVWGNHLLQRLQRAAKNLRHRYESPGPRPSCA